MVAVIRDNVHKRVQKRAHSPETTAMLDPRASSGGSLSYFDQDNVFFHLYHTMTLFYISMIKRRTLPRILCQIIMPHDALNIGIKKTTDSLLFSQ